MKSMLAMLAFGAAMRAASALKECTGEAYYEITMDNLWYGPNEYAEYPVAADGADPDTGAGWSPLVAVTHSGNIQLWNNTMPVTEGVKNIAETGNWSALAAEVEATQEAGDLYVAEGGMVLVEMGTGIAHQNITAPVKVTAAWPWITTISMAVPSPDWYTGMMWNMCDQETGMWVDSFVGGLSPLWDAGTDSGVTYTSPDEVTVPVGTACQYWPVTPECGIGADHPTQTTVFANQNAAGEPWYVANWTVYQVEPPASDAGGAYTGGTTKH